MSAKRALQWTFLAGWSHAYDRVGNKKYQEDLQAAGSSELYGYDNVYRLTNFKRGQLNQDKTDIEEPVRTQTWTLDPLGNWDQTVLDGVSDTRVHNSINELTARTINGNPQISLSYDDAGNLTQDGTADGSHRYTWDYRNRLLTVEVKDEGEWEDVATYVYDARNRRVLKTTQQPGLSGAVKVTGNVWKNVTVMATSSPASPTRRAT